MVLFKACGKKTKYWEESSQEISKTFLYHFCDPPGDLCGHPALTQGKPSFPYLSLLGSFFHPPSWFVN